MTFDAAFSARVGAAGFIGVTWPKEYGGRAQSSLVRFVITEEMLAAGAPCGAHGLPIVSRVRRFCVTAASR